MKPSGLKLRRVEAERVEAERVEAERVEAARIDAERIEAERLKTERLEAERLEAERLEAERLEVERLEAERLEAERLEKERVKAERAEAERIAFENAAAEVNQRLAEEQLQAQRAAALEEDGETVDATSPSPDSALAFDLEDETASEAPAFGGISDARDPSDADEALETDSLHEFSEQSIDEPIGETISDSAFGLAVSQFTGESGSIIEPTADQALPVESATLPTADHAAAGASAPAYDLLEAPFEGLDQHATIAPSTEAHEGLEFFDGDTDTDADTDTDTDTDAVGETVLDDLASFASEKSIDVEPPFEVPRVSDDADDSVALDEAPSSPPDTSIPAAPAPAVLPSAAPAIEQGSSPLAPSAREVTPQQRGQFWTNAATVLGGMPLILPAERKGPLFADGRTLEPPSLDEDQEIDSVSDLIGDLLDEAPKPTARVRTTAPSTPTSLESLAPAVSETPVDETAVDKTPVDERRVAETPVDGTPVTVTPTAEAPVTELPKPSRRPLLGRRGVEDETSEVRSNRLDEQIPPFEAITPRTMGDRGRRDEMMRLESLSRPPVTETDVFAHGSMPSNELALPDELSDDPLSPRGRNRTLPVAPVDLLGDVSVGTNGRRNRPAFGGPPRSPNPAIGRIDLPGDPFWSSANGTTGGANGNANSNGNGKKNGMSPTTGAMLSAKNDYGYDDSPDDRRRAGQRQRVRGPALGG